MMLLSRLKRRKDGRMSIDAAYEYKGSERAVISNRNQKEAFFGCPMFSCDALVSNS